MARRKRSLEERFWSKVDRGAPDDCWPWLRAISQDGYGRFVVSLDPQRVVGAHRVAFELTAGAIPHGMNVLHHCDNPRCVNPAHLYAGTQAQNVADMMRRGRWGGYDPTHCPAGHLYDEANTGYTSTGRGYMARRCRACDRERKRARRQQNGNYQCQ